MALSLGISGSPVGRRGQSTVVPGDAIRLATLRDRTVVALALNIQDATKRFNGVAAVDRVSLAVADGEILGLVGPNGSGKTTLLRCATGLLAMDSGAASIFGHDVVGDRAAAMDPLAFIPEIPAPFGMLTPWEHLLFIARVRNMPAHWEATALEVLGLLELNDKKDSPCSELSKGQRQKVHLAMAFLQRPRLAVLDEPLIGLDPRAQRLLLDWLKARQRAGATAVVSSHSLHFLEGLCQRIAVIEKGHLVVVGTLQELRESSRSGLDATLEDVFLRITQSSPAGSDVSRLS